jgi:hypothetical protein
VFTASEAIAAAVSIIIIIIIVIVIAIAIIIFVVRIITHVHVCSKTRAFKTRLRGGHAMWETFEWASIVIVPVPSTVAVIVWVAAIMRDTSVSGTVAVRVVAGVVIWVWSWCRSREPVAANRSGSP